MITTLMLGLWVALTWFPSLSLAGMGRVSGRVGGSIMTLTFAVGLGASRALDGGGANGFVWGLLLGTLLGALLSAAFLAAIARLRHDT